MGKKKCKEVKNRYMLVVNECQHFGLFEANWFNYFTADVKKLGEGQTKQLMDSIGKTVSVVDPNGSVLRTDLIVEQVKLTFKKETIEIKVSPRLVSSHSRFL